MLACGDVVQFRAPVWVCQDPVSEGRFVTWYAAGAYDEVVALVETRRGDAHVRWSMIEGVDSPVGLLET